MDNFFRYFKREAAIPDSLTPDKAAEEQPPQPKGGNYGKKIVNVRGQKAALSIAAFHRALDLEA